MVGALDYKQQLCKPSGRLQRAYCPMALFAKSKVERFQEEVQGSGLGPGDYDPCVPKSKSSVGAASLGFTAAKGLSPVHKAEAAIEEETETVLDSAAARIDRRSNAAAPQGLRRLTVGGASRLSSSGVSRLVHVEAEHQTKQLAWSEREREKLQAEVVKLREREVSLVLLCF